MSWRRFFIVIFAVLVIGVIGFAFYQFFPQSYVEGQIERVKRDIEKRNDGSSLIYDDLVVKGNETQFSRIIYQDGRTGARVALFDIKAAASRDALENFSADRLEWINPQGNLLSLDNLYVDEISENPNAEVKWNRFLFSRMQAENLTLSGKVPSGADVDLMADQVVMSDMRPDYLDSFMLQNLDIAYTPSIKAHLDDLKLQHLDAKELRAVTAALDAGYIPVKPLSELAGNDLTMEGLQIELGQNNAIENFGGQLADEDVLQLFLNLAPEELTDFIGTNDAGTLKSMLEALGQQDPNDLARGVLQFMLDNLDN